MIITRTRSLIDFMALIEANKDRVSFLYEDKDPVEGFTYSDSPATISRVVWHKERANISLEIMANGKLEIPLNEYDQVLPSFINTRLIKVINIVRNGKLVRNNLKMTLTEELSEYLGVNNSGGICDVDISGLQINRKLDEKQLYGQINDFFSIYWDYLRSSGNKKVANFLLKERGEKVESNDYLTKEYGKEPAAYLRSIGLYPNGYYPKKEKGSNTYDYDAYVFKIDKHTLPSASKEIEKVREKMKMKEPLSGRESLLSDLLGRYITEIESSYGNDPDEWLFREKEIEEEKLEQYESILSPIRFEIMNNMNSQDVYEVEFEGRKCLIEHKVKTSR